MTQQIKQARDAISRMIENGSCPESIAPHIDTILDFLDNEIDGGWKPIETAPKDGSEILFTNGKEYLVVYYDDYDGFTGGLYGSYHEVSEYSRLPDATHWMPLPKPPAKDE